MEEARSWCTILAPTRELAGQIHQVFSKLLSSFEACEAGRRNTEGAITGEVEQNADNKKMRFRVFSVGVLWFQST